MAQRALVEGKFIDVLMKAQSRSGKGKLAPNIFYFTALTMAGSDWLDLQSCQEPGKPLVSCPCRICPPKTTVLPVNTLIANSGGLTFLPPTPPP
eukprot:3634206-Heterocapsa_arctica.AAC.1